MIKYNVVCKSAHEFEGWFRSSDDFDRQAESGLLECPLCGSVEVRKAIMAPAVARSSSRVDAGGRAVPPETSRKLSEMRDAMVQAAKRARDYVEKNYEYVGEKFPEEARRIHYGESDERPIFGDATGKEAKELIDEGVAIAPLPGPVKADRAGPVLPGQNSSQGPGQSPSQNVAANNSADVASADSEKKKLN